MSLFRGSTLFWSKKTLIYPTANRTSSLFQLFYQFLKFVFSPGIFTPKGKKTQKLNTAQKSKRRKTQQNINLYPVECGLVAFYETRSGNEAGLFYNAPEPPLDENYPAAENTDSRSDATGSLVVRATLKDRPANQLGPRRISQEKGWNEVWLTLWHPLSPYGYSYKAFCVI